MVTHELKAWPWEFGRILNGGRAAVRLNDRKFEVGDKIIVKEFDYWKSEFTGHQLELVLNYMQQLDINQYWPEKFYEKTYLYGLSRPIDPILMKPENIVVLKAQMDTFQAIENGSRVDFRDKELKLGATIKYVLVDEDGAPVPETEPLYRFIKRRDLVPILRYYSAEDIYKHGVALLAWKEITNIQAD